MILHWLPVIVALTGQAAPPPVTPPTAPPATVRPAAAIAQSPRPAPQLYSETATGESVIEAAVHAANTDDIRALVIWCANDNERCAAFETARRAAGGTLFSDEYKVGYVNVGQADKNVELAKKYGVTLSTATLPALTILDQKGEVLANLSGADLAPADGTGFDSKKLSAWLTQHQAPQPNATAQFEEGLKQAQREGKTLFVWFSAPW
jgi:hypothetical protein